MKTKKNITKQKKKKSNITLNNSAIHKAKKPKKVKKIQNNKAVLETLKEDLDEQDATKVTIPNRQLVWCSYLKTFSQIEKLNKKQKQIMELCTSKGSTPPKRKRKFLNFIRNCFSKQADVTDEQINDLFDLLLKRYDDFKSGSYSAPESNGDGEIPPKLSVNKKKKLKRAAEKAALESSTSSKNEEQEEKVSKKPKPKKTSLSNNDEGQEEKVGKVKRRKKKSPKAEAMEVGSDDDK